MNIVKNIDQYNDNFVYFCDPIKNNIMNNGNFIRILYSTSIFVLNGIYLNISINQKEETMNKQKKIISKIIQDLHANDQKNFLEIMLTNDNFAEFYNQAKYLEDVYTDLGRTVKQVRLIKEDLDKKKAQAEPEAQPAE